ncbi:MAG: transposase [Gemmatimonadaceae bacterium]
MPLHLIQRGNNRSRIFVREADRECFLDILLDASARTRCDIHAYVLMTNHVHLLATPSSPTAASRMMQLVGAKYARNFNRWEARTGTLFDGRFRGTVVDSEQYYLTCSRYIELNPVRARLAAAPEGHRWSSFHCNALGEADPVVTPHWLYLGLGRNAAETRAAYRALFADPQDAEELDALRVATHSGALLSRVREEMRLKLSARERAAHWRAAEKALTPVSSDPNQTKNCPPFRTLPGCTKRCAPCNPFRRIDLVEQQTQPTLGPPHA